MKTRKHRIARDRFWIGIDLDGTLAESLKDWRTYKDIGKPIPRMVRFVKKLLREGKRVKIYTARVSHVSSGGVTRKERERVIREWCRKHIGRELEITCEKDHLLDTIYDDRCFQMLKSTGITLNEVYAAYRTALIDLLDSTVVAKYPAVAAARKRARAVLDRYGKIESQALAARSGL